jgi:hypothetical protein
VVISSTSQDPRREFEDALETMQLTNADVVWIDPEASPKRVARSHHLRPTKAVSIGASSSRAALSKRATDRGRPPKATEEALALPRKK